MLRSIAEHAAGRATPDSSLLVSSTLLGLLALKLAPAGAAARIVFDAGAYASTLGGAIHGVSGVMVETGPSRADSLSPLGVAHAVHVVPLWGILTGLFVVASVAYAVAIWSRRTAFPACARLDQSRHPDCCPARPCGTVPGDVAVGRGDGREPRARTLLRGAGRVAVASPAQRLSAPPLGRPRGRAWRPGGRQRCACCSAR